MKKIYIWSVMFDFELQTTMLELKAVCKDIIEHTTKYRNYLTTEARFDFLQSLYIDFCDNDSSTQLIEYLPGKWQSKHWQLLQEKDYKNDTRNAHYHNRNRSAH